MIKKACFFIICFAISQCAYAQFTLYGNLSDIETGIHISLATVTLTKTNDNLIVAHTTTDRLGDYSLVLENAVGTYTLTIRHMGYETYSQIINHTGELGEAELEIDVEMVSSSHALDEVVVKAAPPILIKKDTIIYDMDSWMKDSDADVESVIAILPGLKVLADGEIEFKGKPVDHVLIDGQKISDVGSGIITKNITAGNIKSIELRTKEENNKLKKSLLDNKDIIVLDLITQKEVNHNLFGFMEAGAAAQRSRINPQIYSSVFSLKPKIKTHILGEINHIGKPNIKLSKIKNIGAEAYADIFSVPADYNRLTQKETFSQDIYGFQNMASREANIAAMTTIWNISDRWDLFIGSFIENNSLENFEQTTQIIEADEFSFSKSQKRELIDIKSKANLQFNSNREKLVINIDYLSNDDQLDALVSSQDQIQSVNRSQDYDIFSNVQYERYLSKSFAIGLYGLYHNSHRSERINLSRTEDTQDQIFGRLNQANQSIEDSENDYHFSLSLSKKTKRLAFISGMRTFYESYANTKESVTSIDFIGKTESSLYKYEGFISVEGSVGPIRLNSEFALADYSLNNVLLGLEPNYDISLSIPIGSKVSLAANYKDGISGFPYRNTTRGDEIIDFQSISRQQQQNIRLERQRTLEFSLSYDALEKYDWEFGLSGIHGNINNGPNILAQTDRDFVIAYAQNPVPYSFFVLDSRKRFQKMNSTASFEIGYMRLNRYNFDILTNTTNRYMLNLNLTAADDNDRLQLKISNSIRSFQFNRMNGADLISKSKQYVLISDMTGILKSKALDQSLKLNLRYGNIWEATSTNQNVVLSGAYRVKLKPFMLTFKCHNLLNAKTFDIRRITNNFESFSSVDMMPRNVSVTMRYKFDRN